VIDMPRRTLIRGAVLFAAIGLAATLATIAQSMRPRRPLPVLGHVPAFRLTDQRGAPFTTESMLGHVCVVDFIFSRCPESCPRLTARMSNLQERFARRAPDTRLVSFSVDPENDTPTVLSAYAARAHADPSRWTFVTGDYDAVARAVVLGFKVSAAKIARGANDYDVTHGDWMVLVDERGDVRGYYATEEGQDFDTLVRDVERLAHEKP
jgi:protein SCO1/2